MNRATRRILWTLLPLLALTLPGGCGAPHRREVTVQPGGTAQDASGAGEALQIVNRVLTNAGAKRHADSPKDWSFFDEHESFTASTSTSGATLRIEMFQSTNGKPGPAFERVSDELGDELRRRFGNEAVTTSD